MKKITIAFLTTFLSLNISGQTCERKEVKLRYSNGFEVFHVCETNPDISFDENKKYYWYTDFSNVKSTVGGCGGNLLDGNYKFYDGNGNLRVDKNYSFGIEEGNYVQWDSIGNIISKTIFDKGEVVYWKFMNDEGDWVEFNGPMFREGTVRKVYTKGGTLLSEEKILSNFRQHVKVYYRYPSDQLKGEYTKCGWNGDYMCGKYTYYHDNGRIQVEGEYHEGDENNISIGTWKWYNKEGELEHEEHYKAEMEYWPNGELKMAGGLILDEDNNEWVRTGEWRWYDEEGHLEKKKDYR